MAGLLDSVFDPRQYAGLLGDLQRWQRTPEQAQQVFEQPTSTYAFGGQMVPVYGQAPSVSEISSQSRIPQSAPVQQPQAAVDPQVSGADRMRAAMGGFIENAHTGPMGALLGGFMGATTGEYGSRENLTIKALMSKGLDRDMARAAAKNPQLMSAVVPQLFGTKDKTDDIREYEFAKQQGFGGTLEQWMQRKRGGAGEYGMQPIYGTDEKGDPVIMQLGKGGDMVRSKVPDGVKISTGIDKIDLGTRWALRDKRSGAIVGYEDKDIVGKESAEERGKVQGQAQAALPGVELTSQRTIQKIDDFMNSKGFNEVFGVLDQFRPNWTMSDAGRESLSRFKQLSGEAFLEGRTMLKGGGAITDFESAKAESAIARLERSLNEADAKAALNDFKDAVRAGAEKLRAQARGSAQPASPAQPSLPPQSNSGWKIERLP